MMLLVSLLEATLVSGCEWVAKFLVIFLSVSPSR